MTTENKLHVLPRDNGWAIKREGNSRASRIFDTKRGAVAKAKNMAAHDGYVYVHNKDGAIQRVENGSMVDIPSGTMSSQRIHVLPLEGDWAVKSEKTQKPSRVFNTKYSAIRYAHQMADRNNAAMVVHKDNGAINHVDIPPHFTSPVSALLHLR
jgi:uncharacterized protein YdaT